MKKNNLNGALSAALHCYKIEEVHVFPGDSISLSCEFVFSSDVECVIDVESIRKAKLAFIRTLRRSLDKKYGKDN